VHYSVDGEPETLLRQAFLTEAATLDVGVMAASPSGDGFKSRLRGLQIHT
jgi:regulation of enolase protein 1 (concanavalin A-like superfamily)